MKIQDYTQAPATVLIASHCAACGRPLLDAVSVRTGMGPDCADKYNCAQLRGTSEQTRANAVIYALAAEQKSGDWNRLRTLLTELASLGFETVAERIRARLQPKPVVFITSDTLDNGAEGLRIVAPYNAESVAAWRAIPGREFRSVVVKEVAIDKKTKKEVVVDVKQAFNRFPTDQKRAVFALLAKYYPGLIASGCKGIFEIKKAE